MSTPLERVLAKITEIAEESANGDYIYRSESKCHGEVSSNLYREYKADIKAKHFDMKIVQDEVLKEAREYTTGLIASTRYEWLKVIRKLIIE